MFPGLNQEKTNPKVKSLAWVVSREFDYGNVVRFYLVPYKKLVANLSLVKSPVPGLAHYFSPSHSNAGEFHPL